MKSLVTVFTLLLSLVCYGAVPLGTVPYSQLDTNDFGVTVAGHINTRLGIHSPSTPGDTYYLTINGTNINNGGTNFLQSMNPTAGFLPVRGPNTNYIDSVFQSVNGNGIVGNTGSSASRTTNFLYIPFGNGTPVGVPTVEGGRPALYYDATGDLLYAHNPGTGWHIIGTNIFYGTNNFTINPTDWKVGYRVSTNAMGDTGMHPTNVNDIVFDGALMIGPTNTVYQDGIWIAVTNASPYSGWEAVGGDGSTAWFTAGGLIADIRGILGVNLRDNSANEVRWTSKLFTPLIPDAILGGIPSAGYSFPWQRITSLTNQTDELISTNGITLGGVRKTSWPSGGDSSSYWTNTTILGSDWIQATTNLVFIGDSSMTTTYMALSAVQAAQAGITFGSDTTNVVNIGSQDGLIVQGVGGVDTPFVTLNGVKRTTWPSGGGETNWTQTDGTIMASTNVVVVGDPTGVTNVVESIVVPGAISAIYVGDGQDILTLEADAANNNYGSGLFLGSSSITPFIRTGTDITTRTAGDSLTLTGTLTVTNSTPLTTPALEVYGGERHASFYTSTNYTASITNYSITLGGACTNTLMSAASVGEGFWLHVKALAGGGEVWVQNGDFLDNVTNLVLAPWSARSFKSDGTNTWEIH